MIKIINGKKREYITNHLVLEKRKEEKKEITEAQAKIEAVDVIAGGYSKNYAQPKKGRIDVSNLQKN